MVSLKQFAESLINLLYPHLCRACGDDLHQLDQYVCWRCQAALPFTGYETATENPVRRLFDGRLHVQQACSILFFSRDGISQALIHQLKYKNEQELGVWLGRMMGYRLKDQLHYADLDAIVPLPLNNRRFTQRGYNQSELLARGISEVLMKPVETIAVMRTKYTSTQTRKNRLQRWLNVEHVFDLADGITLSNKHILLVDDVITTGATLDACGQVLMQIPGIRLSVCSLAYASK